MNVLLIVYDNGSHIPFFPQGIAYLAGSLKKEGHNVTLYLQDIHHYPDAHLTSVLDSGRFDVVGLGFVAGYYQYRKALSISRAIQASRNRKNFLYVLGGHGPAADPEWFMEKCQADAVCVGDGEEFIKDPIEGVYLHGNTENPDNIPWPDYQSFPMELYRLHRFPGSLSSDFCIPVLSGRGCPFRCTFCYRMDATFRPRSPEAVVEEMRYLNKLWGITHFQFSDELFMSTKQRVHDFCSHMLLRSDIGPNWKWDCNGRLNFADKETLEIMKQAGCNYINYGIESLSQEALNKMKKGLTVDQIIRGVENTREVGIHMGLNFMWGNYGDSYESLEKAVAFLKKYDGIAELRTIRPVTPYPGSALFWDAIRRNLLSSMEDFYTRKHTNSDLFTVSFMDDISEWQGNDALAKANTELVRDYYTRCAISTNKSALRFYGGVTAPEEFRGFRSV